MPNYTEPSIVVLRRFSYTLLTVTASLAENYSFTSTFTMG